MDTDKYGWIVGALGALLAAAQWVWGVIRQRRSEVRRDEITFLKLRMEDIEKRHDLCEERCKHLQEEQVFLLGKVMPLLEALYEIEEAPKRKRKGASAT